MMLVAVDPCGFRLAMVVDISRRRISVAAAAAAIVASARARTRPWLLPSSVSVSSAISIAAGKLPTPDSAVVAPRMKAAENWFHFAVPMSVAIISGVGVIGAAAEAVAAAARGGAIEGGDADVVAAAVLFAELAPFVAAGTAVALSDATVVACPTSIATARPLLAAKSRICSTSAVLWPGWTMILSGASSAPAEMPSARVRKAVENAMRMNARIMLMANVLNDVVASRTDRCDNPYLQFIAARSVQANGNFDDAYIDATAWFRPRDLA